MQPSLLCAVCPQEIFANERRSLRELEDYLESSAAFLHESRRARLPHAKCPLLRRRRPIGGPSLFAGPLPGSLRIKAEHPS